MLTIVTFKWRNLKPYKEQFSSKHVNILYESIKRNLTSPFQFVCVTDNPAGIKEGIITVPVWNQPVLPFNMDLKKPNCFRRLRIFSKEIVDILGLQVLPTRLVVLDLDLVITGSLDTIFNTPGEFVGWNKQFVPYQGAFFMLEPGARPHVWEEFIKDPKAARMRTQELGYRGSDQAWMSACLRPDEKVLTNKDGIYSFAKDNIKASGVLPEDCKICVFHGTWAPWHPEIRKAHSWINEHWHE